MKRLLIADRPPSKIYKSDKNVPDESDKNKSAEVDENMSAESEIKFSAIDLADIFSQVEEIKNCKVAIKNDDEGRLLLAVGDSLYEILEINENRYPRRALRKLES